MSRSDDALAQLEKAAAEVLDCAKGTLGGVGMACFMTTYDQQVAFEKAEAKVQAAKSIAEAVKRFKVEHGEFK